MDKGNHSLNLKELLAPFFVFTIAFATFANSLLNHFAYDDLIHIVENPYIQSLANWKYFFSSATYPGTLYRPLISLSYALTYALVELNPLLYHATNVILHAFISFFIYRLLLKIIPLNAAFLCAIIFAVHPVHVEAVANVSGRAELLCHFFGMLSLLLFLRFTNNKSSKERFYLFPALGLFLLALFSKESAFVYLLLIPLSAWAIRKGDFDLKSQALNFLPLLIPAIIYLSLRYFALGRIFIPIDDTAFIDNPLIIFGFFERILAAFVLLGKYILLSFIPRTLSADYSYAAIDPALFVFDYNAFFYLCFFALFIIFAVSGWRKKLSRSYAFFAIWFFASMSVTANVLFPIGTIFAERLVYLGSLGSIGILVLLLNHLKTESLKLTLISFLMAAFCIQSIIYNFSWKSNEFLFVRQRWTTPDSARTRLNYGIVLKKHGQLEKAKAEVKTALSIFPNYADATFGLASIYIKQNNFKEARFWLQKTLDLNGEHLPAITALGRMYFNEKKYKKALRLIEGALKLDPDYIDAQLGLVAILLVKGKFPEAARLCAKLRKVIPDHPELKQFEAVLKKMRRPGKYI